jgi:serine phosphatase RsbU (regulator of sigma subunit)
MLSWHTKRMTTLSVSAYGDHTVPGSLRRTIRASRAVRAVHDEPGPCGDVAIAVPLPDARIATVLVDVAGHGQSRSLLASSVSSAVLRRLIADGSPAEALAAGDDALRAFPDDLPYAVAFAAILNPATGVAIYASAGHDLAFTLDRDGRVYPLRPTAPMLGIPLTLNPCDALVQLPEQGCFVIASDGVGDSRPEGEYDFFGRHRAAAAVVRALRSAGDPAHALVEAARAHAGDRLCDDASAVVVHCSIPAVASPPHEPAWPALKLAG